MRHKHGFEQMTFIRKGYVDTPSGQLHYRECGQQNKPALVLLHQTPSSSAMYETLMPHLAADYWLIAPDTPGFGQSSALLEPPSVSGYAKAIYSGLKTLGIEHCFLFGHHTGASLAVQLTFEHPAFITKCALSGPPLLTEAQIGTLKSTLPQRTLTDDGRFLQTLYQRFGQKDATLSPALKLRETLSALQAWDSYHAAYQAVFAHDFGAQLAALACPILLISAENDALRDCLEPSLALAQQGEMCVIENAGSYLCEQNSSELAALLQDFFK